jgi:hypothetical protein
VTDSQPVEAYARRRLRQRHTCACGRSSTLVLPPPEGESGPDAADLLTRFFHPTANGSPKRRAVSTFRSGPRLVLQKAALFVIGPIGNRAPPARTR